MSTTQQPEALAELRERLRSFETDHAPDGWPAVRMREISALLGELDNARSDNQVLRLGYAAARLEVESLQRRVQEVGAAARREHERADSAMRAAQPAIAMLGEQAELRRLSDCCPELNLSNYGPDDVGELNGWAIEVSQCIDSALAAQPAGAQQPGAALELLKFYGVTTDAELIAAQARHIERLQARLPQPPSFAPQRVREG